jgi:hypothetical protein
MRTFVIAVIAPPAGVAGRAPGVLRTTTAAGAGAGPVVEDRARRRHPTAAPTSGGRRWPPL